jgi:hypothetical protein
MNQWTCPDFSFFHYFLLGLTFESLKELRVCHHEPKAKVVTIWLCFVWLVMITIWVIVIDVRCTIFVQVGSIMIMSIEVHKLSLVIRIFIWCWMWQGKRWETFFWTCAPIFKAIVVTLSQNVLWVVVCSLPQGHWNKWVLILSMKWSHLHCERWAIKRCGKPIQVCSVIRKCARDR